MPEPLQISPLNLVGSALVNGAGGLLSSGLSYLLGRSNMNKQIEQSKELMDYQWNKFQSPQAQVRAMAAAGLNPAAMFGSGGSGSFASPSVNMPSSSPVNVPPVMDISAIASYVKAIADAKKAGMDTKLSEQDIKNKEVERQTAEFELGLKKQFGKDFQSVQLAQAYRNLCLASDTHDLNQQEKALNEWKIAIEKSTASIKESEQEMARQRLENNPLAIRLENDLMSEKSKTERAQQNELYTRSEVNRENRRIQSALADVEEGSKDEKLRALIKEYQSRGFVSDADAKDALLRLERVLQITDKRSSYFFRELDGLSEWLKSRISIFK